MSNPQIRTYPNKSTVLEPEFKKAWIARLRDPGSKQTVGSLVDSKGGMCCLGHGCDLYEEGEWRYTSSPQNTPSDNYYILEGITSSTMFPGTLGKKVIVDKGMFSYPNPGIDTGYFNREEDFENLPGNITSVNGPLDGPLTLTAVDLNDGCHLTLSQIADCIEYFM